MGCCGLKAAAARLYQGMDRFLPRVKRDYGFCMVLSAKFLKGLDRLIPFVV